MTYKQLQAKARQLREMGKLPKKFRLNQKTEILREAIKSVEKKQTKSATVKGPKATRKRIYETLELQARQKQAITQEDFNTKLIEVYLKEKSYQELENGPVAITRARLEELLKKHHSINKTTFKKLYDKAPGVFNPIENGKELVQLTLEKTEDGTYQLVENTTGNLVA